MSDVRYLGFSLARIEGDGRRGELGRFLPLAEPMPVGSELEVDGERLRVSRVDETEGGCWARAAGDAVPSALQPDATVREVPPDATIANAAPPSAISSEAATDEPPTPEPNKPNDDGSRGGRKRRNKKTVLGR